MANPPLVLIADNDAAVNGLLQEVLRRKGLRTEAVGDGRAALERVARGGVDLLVCDLDMPCLDGHGVLAQLAQRGGAPAVFVVSGYLDPRKEEALHAHAFVRAIYEKPFDVLEFAEACLRAVRGAEAAS